MMAPFPHYDCARCGALEAKAALDATDHFVEVKRLVGESHVGISVRTCPGCQSPWLVVFTERIDWKNGEDPQYVTFVPLTAAESATLDEDNAFAIADKLADGRRFLLTDWPSGAERVIEWTTVGEVVGLHD